MLGYILIIQCIVYSPMALIHSVKLNVKFFLWLLIVITVRTIFNNILKSFVLPCINDKSAFRLSLLIRPFSSVTKFIAEHDRVPHVLRDDGEKCNVMQ